LFAGSHRGNSVQASWLSSAVSQLAFVSCEDFDIMVHRFHERTTVIEAAELTALMIRLGRMSWSPVTMKRRSQKYYLLTSGYFQR
jgi:hypothetical protein